MRFDPERREKHGEYTCANLGCPCDLCKDVRRAYHLKYHRDRGRQDRATYEANRHKHPSLNCYKKHGCRCDGCKRWNAWAVRQQSERRFWRAAG